MIPVAFRGGDDADGGNTSLLEARDSSVEADEVFFFDRVG